MLRFLFEHIREKQVLGVNRGDGRERIFDSPPDLFAERLNSVWRLFVFECCYSSENLTPKHKWVNLV